jgi:xanthine dehydrogenase accessory factor
MTSSLDVLATAQRLQTQGQPFALVSVLRVIAPASARPGDKALVTADGIVAGWIGGGCAQPAVLKTVRQALTDARARVIRIAPAEEGSMRELDDVLEFGMACHSGGTIELFVDPVLPSARLTVIGDSPVAMALAALAPRVGLPVTVVANGVEGADALRFADAEAVLASDEAQAVAAQVAPSSFVVVATQGRRDLQGLRAALAVQARAVFFVASERKAAVLKAALREAHHDAAAVDAIVAPAGTPIGAQTPEEIALSVLGAVVAARRGRSPALAAAPVSPAADAPAAVATVATMAMVTSVPAAAAESRAKRSLLDRIPLPDLPPSRGSCCGG